MDPNQINAMIRRLAALEEIVKSRATADDIPGRRIPYDLVLQVDVGANTTKVTVTETITAAGPHIVTELIGCWRDNTANKFGPVSSHKDLSTTTVNALDAVWALTDTGSGQILSNKEVPSVAFFSEDRPAYLAIPWHIKKNSSVKFELTPIVAPTAAGTIYLVLRGYRILES